MNAIHFLILSITFSFVSCREKDPTEPKPKEPVSSEYMPLSVGNYWVYNRYSTNFDEHEVVEPSLDSFYISKDTTIGNRKYYKVDRNNPNREMMIPLFISDSSGYLLAAPGIILLSPDTTDRFEETGTLSKGTFRSCRVDSIVSTPGGTFSRTITFESAIKYDSGPLVSYYYRVYAKNIGLIQRQIPYSGDPRFPFGIKLLRYHLN